MTQRNTRIAGKTVFSESKSKSRNKTNNNNESTKIPHCTYIYIYIASSSSPIAERCCVWSFAAEWRHLGLANGLTLRFHRTMRHHLMVVSQQISQSRAVHQEDFPTCDIAGDGSLIKQRGIKGGIQTETDRERERERSGEWALTVVIVL